MEVLLAVSELERDRERIILWVSLNEGDALTL